MAVRRNELNSSHDVSSTKDLLLLVFVLHEDEKKEIVSATVILPHYRPSSVCDYVFRLLSRTSPYIAYVVARTAVLAGIPSQLVYSDLPVYPHMNC